MSDKDQVGFLPVEICPVCKEPHEIKLTYKNIPMVACDKLPSSGFAYYDINHFAHKDGKRLFANNEVKAALEYDNNTIMNINNKLNSAIKEIVNEGIKLNLKD